MIIFLIIIKNIMSLTGNKDIDSKIFLSLSDKDLENISRIDKKTRSIYENDMFWFNRIIVKFPGLNQTSLKELRVFLEFDNYRKLYDHLLHLPTEIISMFYFHRVKFLLDKIDVPEYVDRNKFVKTFKRRFLLITGSSSNEILKIFESNKIELTMRQKCFVLRAKDKSCIELAPVKY
jgi:hypothetical protein